MFLPTRRVASSAATAFFCRENGEAQGRCSRAGHAGSWWAGNGIVTHLMTEPSPRIADVPTPNGVGLGGPNTTSRCRSGTKNLGNSQFLAHVLKLNLSSLPRPGHSQLLSSSHLVTVRGSNSLKRAFSEGMQPQN